MSISPQVSTLSPRQVAALERAEKSITSLATDSRYWNLDLVNYLDAGRGIRKTLAAGYNVISSNADTPIIDSATGDITPPSPSSMYSARLTFTPSARTYSTDVEVGIDVSPNKDGSITFPIGVARINSGQGGAPFVINGMSFYAADTFYANGGRLYIKPRNRRLILEDLKLFIKEG